MLVYQRIKVKHTKVVPNDLKDSVLWNEMGLKILDHQDGKNPSRPGAGLWASGCGQHCQRVLHPKRRESRKTDVQEDGAGLRCETFRLLRFFFVLIYDDLCWFRSPVIVDDITTPTGLLHGDVRILCHFPRFPWQFFFAGHFARPKMVWTSSSTSGTIPRIPPSADGGVDLVLIFLWPNMAQQGSISNNFP